MINFFTNPISKLNIFNDENFKIIKEAFIMNNVSLSSTTPIENLVSLNLDLIYKSNIPLSLIENLIIKTDIKILYE